MILEIDSQARSFCKSVLCRVLTTMVATKGIHVLLACLAIIGIIPAC